MTKSLASGTLTQEAGLLEQATGRTLIVNMAERLEAQPAAMIASAIDDADRSPESAFCTLLLDEGESLDEAPPHILTERMGFTLDLRSFSHRVIEPFLIERADIEAARARVDYVKISDDYLEAVVSACTQLGAFSMRSPLFCVYAAKGIAALDGRTEVSLEDLSQACQLVLPQMSSAAPEDTPPDQSPPDPGDSQSDPSDQNDEASSEQASPEELETILVDAVNAVASLDVAKKPKGRADRRARGPGGRSGDLVQALDKGRPDRPTRQRKGNSPGEAKKTSTIGLCE